MLEKYTYLRNSLKASHSQLKMITAHAASQEVIISDLRQFVELNMKDNLYIVDQIYAHTGRVQYISESKFSGRTVINRQLVSDPIHVFSLY